MLPTVNIVRREGVGMRDSSWAKCGLASWGVVRIPWDEILQLRTNPGPHEGLSPLPHLKLADEQTVLGFAAVASAIDRGGLSPTQFGKWGVLSGPRYFGRARIAQIIARFQKLGPRSVAPLGIPTLSQHSIASTISLILGSHGPVFGVSGNPGQLPEVLLDSMSILANHDCPGLWAVMTGFEPEPTPDLTGQVIESTTGFGIAFAVVPGPSTGSLKWISDHTCGDEHRSQTLSTLADQLDQFPDVTFRLGIPQTGYIEIEPGALSAPLRQAG